MAKSRTEYFSKLRTRCRLPAGFQVATLPINFVYGQRIHKNNSEMNLSLIHADEPITSFGAMLTRNRIVGAPIIMARQRLQQEAIQTLLINTRIANVGIETGLKDAESLCKEVGARLAIDPDLVMSISTGVIGWKLPVEKMKQKIPSLVEKMHYDNALEVAEAIMTTDTFPKAHCAKVGDSLIMALGKGAGMVSPNLATMLVFILTDADIGRDDMREALQVAVDSSFAHISIDGDQSTSDMVLAMSSRKKPCENIALFTNKLTAVCTQLAHDIVRNGEGVGHVLEVMVEGAASREHARSLGMAIIHSPLVGTAIFGNDHNAGRIVSVVGNWAFRHDVMLDPRNIEIEIGDTVVYKDGFFRLTQELEQHLALYLTHTSQHVPSVGYPEHSKTVYITVRLGMGTHHDWVLGSDLSDEYVHINADYRS